MDKVLIIKLVIILVGFILTFLFLKAGYIKAPPNEADVENYERRQKAEADQYEVEKRAEGIRKMGEAEAYAIRLKAIAEAEGIDRKAEAMKKYGQAAIMEIYFNILPEMAKNIAEPMSVIDKISIIGGNSTDLSKNAIQTITQI